MAKISALVVVGVAVILTLCSVGSGVFGQKIGADPESLMRIIGALCNGEKDENFASNFYGCYSLLQPNEQCIFERCQKEIFGCTLSTKKNIEYSCTQPQKLQPYVGCLMSAFGGCGLDVVGPVTTINVCQGQLLGLE